MTTSKSYANKSNAKRAALIAAVKESGIDAKVIKADLETYVEFKGNKDAGFTFELLAIPATDEVVKPELLDSWDGMEPATPSHTQDETLNPNLEEAGYEHLEFPVDNDVEQPVTVDNDVEQLYPHVVKDFKLVSVSIVKEPVNPDCKIVAVKTTEPKIVGVDLASGPDKTVEATITVNAARVTKIQKNRESCNGITRPTEGGKCAIIWDICDSLTAKRGSPVPSKPVKEACLKEYINEFTIRTQYARWRKFNGITGRIVDKKES